MRKTYETPEYLIDKFTIQEISTADNDTSNQGLEYGDNEFEWDEF